MEELPPDPLLRPGTFIDPDTTGGGSNQADPSTPIHDPDGAAMKEDGNHANADSDLPDWLPPGWKVDFRVRTSGASAGHTDKYYYHPSNSRRFRSRKEVMRFLENGEPSSKKTKKADGEASSSTKSKQPDPKTIVENFNFNEPPEKVKWVLNDIIEDTWSAVVGDTKVPESTKQEWAVVYQHLSLQENDSKAPSA